MAHIDDGRAKLVAGQAARLRDEAGKADELLRQGKIDEAREMLARNVVYARAIWHELSLLIEPPREPRVRCKSRSR
jgi:hypothetical protein